MLQQLRKDWYLWVLGLIILISAVLFFDFKRFTDITYIEHTVSSFGWFGPIIFIVLMALAVIISPLPSLPLDFVAGALWGPFFGTLFALIGALIGAVISFYIARFIGRPLIERFFHKKIIICDGCNEATFFWVIAVSRMLPFFQFDLISYGSGLTRVKISTFAVATFIGMIPFTYVFVKFGEVFRIGSVSSILFSIVLIILMFVIPYAIGKHNLFGLRSKIMIK